MPKARRGSMFDDPGADADEDEDDPPPLPRLPPAPEPDDARRSRTAPRRGANQRRLEEARESATQDLYDALRNDTSEHAIGADDDILWWLCEASVTGRPDLGSEHSKARKASNWKWWERYCAALRLQSTWRPDTSDTTGTRREAAIWAGALAWIYARMQPAKGRYLPEGPPHYGRPKPPSPQSAIKVLRGVRAEHIARGLSPPPLALATRRCNELMYSYMEQVGAENCVPKRKAPLTHLLITSLLAIKDAPILEKGATWSYETVYGVSVYTLFHVLAQAGFRKDEIALNKGEWHPSKRISFANLSWVIDGKPVLYPTHAQLQSLRVGDYAKLYPPPSKADQWGMRWGNYPIWLPFDPDAPVNAARALARWEMVAKVPHDKRHETPLFCGPGGVGTTLRARAIDELLRRMLTMILGDEKLARQYTMHSWRAYLASAMLAAGCTDAQIQAALRWASADAVEIYKVANREQYGGWLLRAEKEQLTGERLIQLLEQRRFIPVTDGDELAGIYLDQRKELDSTAERADTRDSALLAAIGRPAPLEDATAAFDSDDPGLEEDTSALDDEAEAGGA